MAVLTHEARIHRAIGGLLVLRAMSDAQTVAILDSVIAILEPTP